jgi:hypothetical protein
MPIHSAASDAARIEMGTRSARYLPLIALGLFATLASSCSRSERVKAREADCDGRLGSLAGVGVSRAEVEVLAADTAAAGARLNLGQALRDLLWQEAERQRLGLPGGAQIARSRREAIRRYRRERLHRGPIDTRGELPEGTELTACGHELLKQQDDAEQ